MSFDLYFVPPPADGRWDTVMEDLERQAAEERSLTAEDLALWARIVDAVKVVIPKAALHDGERFRELDDGEAMQLTMHPGEISVTVPYWFEGDEATRIVEKLRRVCAAIEAESGLVAYDPQADRPFLDGGAATAPASFDRAADALRTLTASGPDRRARRGWAFWRR